MCILDRTQLLVEVNPKVFSITIKQSCILDHLNREKNMVKVVKLTLRTTHIAKDNTKMVQKLVSLKLRLMTMNIKEKFTMDYLKVKGF